jgi:hypothetical protein
MDLHEGESNHSQACSHEQLDLANLLEGRRIAAPSSAQVTGSEFTASSAAGTSAAVRSHEHCVIAKPNTAPPNQNQEP